MADGDLIDELGELVRELRGYLEWQQVEGASGIPRDPRSAEELRRTISADDSNPLPVVESMLGVKPAAEPLSNRGEVPDRVVRSPLDQLEAKLGTLSRPVPPPSSPLPVINDTLEQLALRVAGCTQCSLHERRTQTVFARGTGSSGLCFVGEGPGAEEDAQGLPFVGAAGQLLDKMITAMGFDRNDVYVCNVVKCRPPENRNPTDEEVRACAPYLERQLSVVNPQVIVTLGGTASSGLLGDPRGITKIRGKFRLYRGTIAVMPTFHPAYLLRNPSAKREAWDDLRQVVQHMGRTLPK